MRLPWVNSVVDSACSLEINSFDFAGLFLYKETVTVETLYARLS